MKIYKIWLTVILVGTIIFWVGVIKPSHYHCLLFLGSVGIAGGLVCLLTDLITGHVVRKKHQLNE